MTAGADLFASGLFTRFDVTFLVCEPTLRSVGVYRQHVGYARDFGVRVHVVGNKVDDASDVDFLRAHVSDDLLTWLARSAYVKGAERGGADPIGALGPANRAALETLRAAADAAPKDWRRYARQAAAEHRRLRRRCRPAGFADHAVPPPSEAERGQVLRALASGAIRGGLERHFGVTLAFQNCHRLAAFRSEAVGGDAYRQLVSPLAQIRNSRRSCATARAAHAGTGRCVAVTYVT
jgi:hypothetical protein